MPILLERAHWLLVTPREPQATSVTSREPQATSAAICNQDLGLGNRV